MRRLGLAFVILAATYPLLGNSSGDSCVLQFTSTSPGWIAYRVKLSDEEARLTDSAVDIVGAHALLWYMLNGTTLVHSGGVMTAPISHGAHVESDAAGAPIRLDTSSDLTHPGGPTSAYYNRPGPFAQLSGDLTFLAFSAGEAKRWSIDLCGEGWKSSRFLSSGADVFILQPEDFDGTLDVDVHVQGAGARVQRDLAKSVEISRNLIGVYFDRSLEANQRFEGQLPSPTWAQTPRGLVECHCWFEPSAATEAWPAGTYEFHLSSTGAGFSGLHEVILAGADVPLTEVLAS